MTDTLLAYYCNVAGHPNTCDDWHMHRHLINMYVDMLQAQLDAIPDAMAIGKTVQQAAETGQQSVTGYDYTEYRWKGSAKSATVEYQPDDIHEVHWNRGARSDGGFWTEDPVIPHNKRRQIFLQDMRAVTAIAYKGICRAHVFVDGEPDIWNEWK